MVKKLDLPDWVTRGISEIFPSQNPEQDLSNRLNETNKGFRKLRVKFGIDPTGTDIHIGHSILFKKLIFSGPWTCRSFDYRRFYSPNW